MAAKTENMRSIDRAIDVLECIAVERRPLAIGELEKRANLSRPTLYRILSTLISRKYVSKDGEPPRYRLDSGAGRLAGAWNDSLEIARLAEPLMKNLHDRYDETVALYLRKDDTRVCVSEMPSRQALSFSRGLGYSGTLLRGASGLAMLAFADRAEAAQIIGRSRDRNHASSARRRLPEIRETGYAISSGDFIAGAQAIASPIFDRRGQVVGSLGVFGPSVRFDAKRIKDCAKAVKEAAALLSSVLGR